ncbi:MAG: RNA 2',3'-cyclic phosphodiesterase, partial [Terriglobia bacterium]
MKVFIAIDLPSSIRRELERKQDALRAALSSGPSREDQEIRWVRPEAIHLTLKFLGEISEPELERLIEHLRRLGPFEAFPVEVSGFGFFPDARRPRVLWAGVTASPPLLALAAKVEAAAAGSGFEIRPFRPHLTLARFRSSRPQSILEVIAKREEDASMGRFTVSEFAVFESKLSKT